MRKGAPKNKMMRPHANKSMAALSELTKENWRNIINAIYGGSVDAAIESHERAIRETKSNKARENFKLCLEELKLYKKYH